MTEAVLTVAELRKSLGKVLDQIASGQLHRVEIMHNDRVVGVMESPARTSNPPDPAVLP